MSAVVTSETKKHSVFVQNPTYTHRNLMYRVKGQERIRTVTIRATAQIELSEKFQGGKDLDAIVAQIKQAGGIPFDQPHYIKTPFSLIYRIDRRIEQDDANVAAQKDVEARQERSADLMEQLAASTFSEAEKISKAGTLNATTLEVEEMDDARPGEEVAVKGVNTVMTVDKRAPRKRQDSKK